MDNLIKYVIGLICVMGFGVYLYKQATYHFKMIVFLLGAGLIVLCCMPFMLFRPKDYRNALMPAWACRWLGRLIGVRMEIRGLENVRSEHGSVVLMNHQSVLDLLVLAYLWPVIGRATVVSKKEILYIPFFGIGAWLWGTLFIDRSQREASITSLNKESKAIQIEHCKLLLFPEGTRNSTGTLLPFKKGSFHIAVQNQCPIQPVIISHYNFLNGKKKIFDSGRAIIHILPEINTTKYKDDVIELIKDCRSIMQSQFKKLNTEIQAQPQPQPGKCDQ